MSADVRRSGWALAAALALSGCAGPRPPADDIVGTWRNERYVLRFEAGGALRWREGAVEETGSYSFPGPSHISMRVGTRWAGGSESRKMGVVLRGETLELCEDTDPHMCLAFRRVGRRAD